MGVFTGPVATPIPDDIYIEQSSSIEKLNSDEAETVGSDPKESQVQQYGSGTGWQ